MRKWMTLLLCAALCISLTACGQPAVQTENGKLTILTTIFPEYDWLRNLTAGSDGVEVKLLIDKGVDLHSYQPSVRDIVDIATCDVFVYTGGDSDVWVEEALETAMNEKMLVVNLMERLEQYRELCQEEHEHQEEGHDHAADEHIWLSLRNAVLLCRELTDILETLDSDNSSLYAANCDSYAAQLEALDMEYAAMAETAKHREVVFADRFPFVYLMEDYGLGHDAAYEGCSAETEVGFETFARLSDKVNAMNLDAVVVIDDSDKRIANTVLAAAGDDSREIYTLQSMQAVHAREIARGVTYLGVMEENLNVFRKVLN